MEINEKRGKYGLTLGEYVKKYCPDCELMIVNKKNVEKVKFYIKQLNGGGYYDKEFKDDTKQK